MRWVEILMAPKKSIYYEMYLILFIIRYIANHSKCYLFTVSKTFFEY